jgi:hypothetical protein
MDLDFLLKAVQVARIKYVDETWGNWMRVEGTKTITLWKSPQQGRALVDRILRYYRKDLPLIERFLVTVEYEVKILWERFDKAKFEYYLRTYLMNPKNIITKTKDMIMIFLTIVTLSLLLQ